MEATETNRDEMHRLAAYLRQNPGALRLSAEEIAAGSGVGTDAVRSVVARPAVERRESRAAAPRKSLTATLSGFADKLFKFPLAFVVVTFVFGAIAMMLIPETKASAEQTARGMEFSISDAVELSIGLFIMTLHMLCYFWRAMARFPLWGAAIVGVATSGLTLFSVLREPAVQGQAVLPLMIVFGMGVLTILYGFVGIGFSSLGGYLRFRREEAVLRRRSRQELLQRLFEIEEALRRPETPLGERRIPWLDRIRKNIFLWAIGIGAVLGLLVSVSLLIFPAPPEGSRPTDAYTGFFVTQLFLSVLAILLQMGMAYLGGGPVRSILVSLAFGYASTLVAFIPIGSSVSRIMSGNMLANFIAGTTMAALFGLFAGLGASVEQRALQSRRRQANDPQVLLSEFVEIQRLLNPTSQSKCVMVVDAARSSAMKANADPLVAEWSFRAYQEFIAEHVRTCGGAIYSTAGDGAMASFDSAACAFECARTIQTKIADFNAYVNKLKDPFRLRIGIHCGEVSGELDEVQFTAVLDIAAHVEAASQVGGIAVTASVKDQLPDHRFAEIQDVIDEQRVFLALNPTLDPE